MHKVYVFDAYGTLFDVHAAVRRHAEEVGPDADRLSAIWRHKQLEYSWMRALAGRYRDFWALTEDALDTAFRSVPSAPRTTRETLLDAYAELDAYPEVIDVLTQLRDAGAKTAILSNGNQAMLELAVKAARIGGLLDEVCRWTRCSLQAAAGGLRTGDHPLSRLPGRGLVPVVQPVGHRRRHRRSASARCGSTATGAPDEYADLPPAVTLSSLKGLATV